MLCFYYYFNIERYKKTADRESKTSFLTRNEVFFAVDNNVEQNLFFKFFIRQSTDNRLAL